MTGRAAVRSGYKGLSGSEISDIRAAGIVCHLTIGTKAVAERSVGLRRCLVRDAGGIGSANAGMSSDKECEKHSRRKSKGSSARLIRRG